MGESVAGLVSFFNPVWFKREVGKEVIQTKTPLSSRIGASRRVELSLIGCVLLAGPTGVSGGLRDVCRCYGGARQGSPSHKGHTAPNYGVWESWLHSELGGDGLFWG